MPADGHISSEILVGLINEFNHNNNKKKSAAALDQSSMNIINVRSRFITNKMKTTCKFIGHIVKG